MAEINWTAQSLDDIENIAEFIARDSERYANIQARRFFEAAEILESNPEFGRIVPELNTPAIREIILGNYRIIYRIVSSELIDILTIHNSKRQLSNNPAFRKK